MTGGCAYDYIAVGHVTRDVIEDAPGGPASQAGGGAFYSGLQASRLGLRTLIVTQGAPAEIYELLAPYRDELDLNVIPAPHTTTLGTRGTGANRTQRVLSWAGPISQALELHGRIVHFAPVAREKRISWGGSALFVGITPQGLIRRWLTRNDTPPAQLDPGSLLGDVPPAPHDHEALGGRIRLTPLAPIALPTHFDAAVIGEQERPYCRALFTAARKLGAVVAVTAGSQPTTICLPADADEDRSVAQVAPPAAVARDDLGAGDVFAATFFVALARGHTPIGAARLGNAAAGVRIAGVGPAAIGTRAQVESVAKAALAG